LIIQWESSKITRFITSLKIIRKIHEILDLIKFVKWEFSNYNNYALYFHPA